MLVKFPAATCFGDNLYDVYSDEVEAQHFAYKRITLNFS